MPRLSFYAANEDILPVFDFIFENGFEVYELYSEYDQDLAMYKSTEAVWGAYQKEMEKKGDRPSLILVLWHPGMGGSVLKRRVELDPKRCSGHTYRYKAEGWGLAQMELGGKVAGQRISMSWIIQGSEKSADAYQTTNPELGDYRDWDWNAVAKYVRMIQNRIKKLSTGKHGPSPLLACAAQLVSEEQYQLS